MPDFENLSHDNRLESNAEQIKDILNDPAASFWLKAALEAALKRDVLDAAKDAAILFALLDQRSHIQAILLNPLAQRPPVHE